MDTTSTRLRASGFCLSLSRACETHSQDPRLSPRAYLPFSFSSPLSIFLLALAPRRAPPCHHFARARAREIRGSNHTRRNTDASVGPRRPCAAQAQEATVHVITHHDAAGQTPSADGRKRVPGD